MRVLILGGDGYLGWAQAMHLSLKGHAVMVLDNLARRGFDQAQGFGSIIPLDSIHGRIAHWQERTGREIGLRIGSTSDFSLLRRTLTKFRPEAVVHFAEQKSAPFSMLDRDHAWETTRNNLEGTINILYAIKEIVPDCHLVKLGTMGEYGTPNIDIEEGYLQIRHKGRTDRLLFPKNPGSFYHLSKVHGSHTIKKCCDWWGIRATDLNQGVVYGTNFNQVPDKKLATRFDYDQIYGTVLNRFCVQAALGIPLSVYGTGGQTRGFIHLNDAIRCVELAILNPPAVGEYRVFNQFTELFSVAALAKRVQTTARRMGIRTSVVHLENPRIEVEDHYYQATNQRIRELGLDPTPLSAGVIGTLIEVALRHRKRIDPSLILPTVKWGTLSNRLGHPAPERRSPKPRTRPSAASSGPRMGLDA